MGVKERELVARLSTEEQHSLRELCRCCCKTEQIPGEHAEKLLILGLAEMTCGGLGPTSSGRHVAALGAAHAAVAQVEGVPRSGSAL